MIPYFGSYLVEIRRDGRFSLPATLVSLLNMRSKNWLINRELMLAPNIVRHCLFFTDHECITSRFERLVRDVGTVDTIGFGAESLGLFQNISVDDDGAFALPSFFRSRYRIDRELLLVGTGETIELWSPAVAAAYGQPDLAVAVAACRQARAEADATEWQRLLPFHDGEARAVVAHG